MRRRSVEFVTHKYKLMNFTSPSDPPIEDPALLQLLELVVFVAPLVLLPVAVVAVDGGVVLEVLPPCSSD
jgi:hypothetical protein